MCVEQFILTQKFKNMEIGKDCICKGCNGKFKSYIDQYDCQNCDDGDQEVDNEFGEGSYYRRCRYCKGLGVIEYVQEDFCCEECGAAFDDDNL